MSQTPLAYKKRPPRKKPGDPDYVPVGRPPKNKDGEKDITYKLLPTRYLSIYLILTEQDPKLIDIELDTDYLAANELTKLLPAHEHRALVDYWDRYRHDTKLVSEQLEYQKKTHEYAVAGHNRAHEMAKAEGMDTLTLPEQMTLTCMVIDNGLQYQALVLANTNTGDLFKADDAGAVQTDRTAVELWRTRVQVFKDLSFIRNTLADLAQKLIVENTGQINDKATQDQALDLIQRSNALLKGRGA